MAKAGAETNQRDAGHRPEGKDPAGADPAGGQYKESGRARLDEAGRPLKDAGNESGLPGTKSGGPP